MKKDDIKNSNNTSKALFEKIISYTDSETEAERKQKIDDELLTLETRKAELEKKANALIRKYGISYEDLLWGNSYYKSDEIEPIKKEIRGIKNKLANLYHKKKYMIFDDELQSINERLDKVTAEKDEMESLLNLKRKQLEESRGSLAFEEYKKLDVSVYELEISLKQKRAEITEILKQKSNYIPKADLLLMEYEKAKDNETRADIAKILKEAMNILAKSNDEKKKAEEITFGRKGQSMKAMDEFNSLLTIAGGNWRVNVKNTLQRAIGEIGNE